MWVMEVNVTFSETAKPKKTPPSTKLDTAIPL